MKGHAQQNRQQVSTIVMIVFKLLQADISGTAGPRYLEGREKGEHSPTNIVNQDNLKRIPHDTSWQLRAPDKITFRVGAP